MANSFLLSMLSPVWRAKLCGEVGGNPERRLLNLDSEHVSLFSKVVALGSGASVTLGDGLDELIGLVRMADQYHRVRWRRFCAGPDDGGKLWANSDDELWKRAGGAGEGEPQAGTEGV